MVDENKCLVSAVDFYFIEEDGGRFKATLPFSPYFYVLTRSGTERDVSSFLSRKLSGRLAGIDLVDKEDMDMVTDTHTHTHSHTLTHTHSSLHIHTQTITLTHTYTHSHIFRHTHTITSTHTHTLSHTQAKPPGWPEKKVPQTEVPVGRGPHEGQERHYTGGEEEQGEREIAVCL